MCQIPKQPISEPDFPGKDAGLEDRSGEMRNLKDLRVDVLKASWRAKKERQRVQREQIGKGCGHGASRSLR